MTRCRFAAAVTSVMLFILPARGAEVLRIAMTASDIPTTTGMPNNGFEGLRFLGYPIFEGLVLWDLASTDRLAGLRPGLAEQYEQAADKKTWIFHLRHGVKFHDGTDFNSDAVIWNLDRYFNNDSPQFEPAGAGMTRARVPVMGSYRKIDDFTVAISTKEPASYFPYMAVYILFTSPASFEKAGRDWGRAATLPAAGTGPFRLTKVLPREFAELARFDAYWDQGHKAKLDSIRLLPIPEANSRLAALRSGQVDWIEVPPPDGIPSLKAAGFAIVTNSYPHVWPWMLARYFSSANFSPVGYNFEHWKDDEFDAALAELAESTNPASIDASYRAANQRLVDNPPWLFIVHDLNPRAMSKRVQGFVSPQSWFLDLTLVSMH
jgi:peptide/nickel transport system substrate-binding protein